MAKAKRPTKEKSITKPTVEEIPTSLEELARLGAEDTPKIAAAAEENVTQPVAPVDSATTPAAAPVEVVTTPVETANESGLVQESTATPTPTTLDNDNSQAALTATLELVTSNAEKDHNNQDDDLPDFVFPPLEGGNPLAALGPALKARRESLGLSFAEITRRTCMAQSTILALESQPLDKLDAAFYIKNRLGLYATVLEIDPKKIQEFFNTCLAAKEEKTQTLNHSSSLKRWLIIGSIILVLAAVAVLITLK